MSGEKIIRMKTVRGVDFSFHIENGEVVVDLCEGACIPDRLDMFSFEIETLKEMEAAEKRKVN
jgi:hypothetical protein